MLYYPYKREREYYRNNIGSTIIYIQQAQCAQDERQAEKAYEDLRLLAGVLTDSSSVLPCDGWCSSARVRRCSQLPLCCSLRSRRRTRFDFRRPQTAAVATRNAAKRTARGIAARRRLAPTSARVRATRGSCRARAHPHVRQAWTCSRQRRSRCCRARPA